MYSFYTTQSAGQSRRREHTQVWGTNRKEFQQGSVLLVICFLQNTKATVQRHKTIALNTASQFESHLSDYQSSLYSIPTNTCNQVTDTCLFRTSKPQTIKKHSGDTKNKRKPILRSLGLQIEK